LKEPWNCHLTDSHLANCHLTDRHLADTMFG
jgi:hypothetical protein